MVNWQDIHQDFTPELQKEWEEKGFNKEQVKEWIDIGLKTTDADYTKWLRDIKKVNVEWVLDHGNNEQLRREYEDYSISRWHRKGFTDEEITSWISIGLGLQDGGYAAWMRDILEITPSEYPISESNDEERKKVKGVNSKNKIISKDNYLNLEKGVSSVMGKNAQEWLDENYPKEKRSLLKSLYISEKNLEGHLSLQDFVNLERLDCHNNQLTGLDLSNCLHLVELDCKNNRLSNLNLAKCKDLDSVDFSYNQLTELSTIYNNELTHLIGYYNNITKLNLENNINLQVIALATNLLTDIVLPTNPLKLRWLDLRCNDFPKRDLSFLSPYINLENLLIGNVVDTIDAYQNHEDMLRSLNSHLERRILQGIYNHFYGSLEYLKDMSKLKWLYIVDTDIDNGLEYLPESVETFSCYILLRSNSKLKDIIDELKGFEVKKAEFGYATGMKQLTLSYDLNAWREYKNKKRKLEKTRQELRSLLTGLKIGEEDAYQVVTASIQNSEFDLNKASQIFKKLKEIETTKSGNNGELLGVLNNLRNEASNELAWNAINEYKRDGQDRGYADEMLMKLNDWANELTHKVTLEGIDIAPLIPISLHESLKKGNKLEENFSFKEEIAYSEIEGSEGKTNHWKTPQLLPIRLYDINEEKIIEIKEVADIDHYAILSYSWGGKAKENVEWSLENAEKRLSEGGKKSFAKALEACRELRIDYLWMDQFCINQNEKTPEEIAEMNQEVPKMRQYYSNAAVTLISIQTKLHQQETDKFSLIDIIALIIKSEWFSRSWCFQEGWLSKHTIFMFDDTLVDGRELAATWVLHQPGYSDYVIGKLEEISNYSAKIATPIGWVYNKEGYNSKDKISLSLSQALRGIKERGRAWPIDGIYSILGLLPYGEKVQPKYEAWGHKYTKEELEKALADVVKTAWENGYAELLAWHGEGDGLISDIVDSEKCATNITGGILIKRKESESEVTLPFAPEGIKINGLEYIIDSITSELSEIENKEGFLIDGGLCTRDVRVKIDNKDGHKEVKLWGTRESLQKIKKGNSLITLSKNEWESNIPFAILALRKGKFYHRLGLVELRSEAEKLTGKKERKITFKMNEQVQVAQIEQPTK